jgi:MFS family permease
MRDVETAVMARNVRLYPWYTAAFNCFAWMPVFFLYFNQHMTVEHVLRLEALYYLATVVLEVPSGYFSDIVGRRRTLLISSVALVGAYTLFVMGQTFLLFAVAQGLLATAVAFNSGTDTSLLYDSLVALERAEEFGRREAVAMRRGLLANTVAVLLGGVVGSLTLRGAYVLSLAASLATLGVVCVLREPQRAGLLGMPRPGFFRQLQACLTTARQPLLAWLFAAAVLMFVLIHVPYEFYQPYLSLLETRLTLPVNSTPLAAGVCAALSTLSAAWVAGRSIHLRDRLGMIPLCLLAMGLQILLIALMGLVLHVAIATLFLLRSSPWAMMRAPLNAAIAPHVSQAQLATYLSLQSFAGRLAFAGVLFGLSHGVGIASPPDWASLAFLLRVCTVVGLCGFGVLLLTIRRGGVGV